MDVQLGISAVGTLLLIYGLVTSLDLKDCQLLLFTDSTEFQCSYAMKCEICAGDIIQTPRLAMAICAEYKSQSTMDPSVFSICFFSLSTHLF
jgi:hypothetical protein